ncbi:sensor histidine kinase [Microbacterium sp.]|uniref:sensor histidine kinase n=1 Tax=Microbacterium sp. TaxID=51671 RepID=UPI003C783E93
MQTPPVVRNVAVAISAAVVTLLAAASPAILTGFPHTPTSSLFVGPVFVAAATFAATAKARTLAWLFGLAGAIWVAVGLAVVLPPPLDSVVERAALVPCALVIGAVGAIPTGTLVRRSARVTFAVAVAIAIVSGTGALSLAVAGMAATVVFTLSRRGEFVVTLSKLTWALALVVVDLARLAPLVPVSVAAALFDILLVIGSIMCLLLLERYRMLWAAYPRITETNADEYGARLARALDIPAIRVVLPTQAGRLLDARGRIAQPITDAVVVVDRDGTDLAHLSPGVLDAPVTVEALRPVLRRVSALARSRHDARRVAATLRRSRALLLEVADRERADLDRLLSTTVIPRVLAAADLARRAQRSDLADHGVSAAESVRSVSELVPEAATLAGLLSVLERPGVEVEVTGDAPLSRSAARSLWYFCSEALANSAKHSGVATACVRGECEGDTVVISVADDGVGGADTAGSGIRGLFDRAAVLGGRARIDSRAGAGTVVALVTTASALSREPATYSAAIPDESEVPRLLASRA